jgi:UDP-N-acetylglucosamine 4,6-dehydratase
MARVLIFGGSGSLGKKLIDRWIGSDDVAVFSRDEAKHFTIRNEYAAHSRSKHLSFYVGDIRDYLRVREILVKFDPEIVIIAAALKQVETCELSPFESVQTNLLGTQNIVRAVDDLSTSGRANISRVLFVSTDKACSSVNVYGMCKAISERIVTSMKAPQGKFGVKYMCTRYGNVLESRGSIIPLFKYQSMHADFLTVTDPDMTRFVMTLDDSVDLIEHALKWGHGGETWIPRIPAMRIGDLAELFSEMTNKEIKVIGLRPGEKRHEDLLNESEAARSRSEKNHYVIGPAYEPGNNKAFTYTSADDVMTKAQLKEHLTKLGIFDMELSEFVGVKIEEIITNRKS